MLFCKNKPKPTKYLFHFLRWKVFQCLLLEGENAGTNALRNAERFYITENTFNEFLQRHSDVKCLVPESNTKMQNSYLILDEYVSKMFVIVIFMHICLSLHLARLSISYSSN